MGSVDIWSESIETRRLSPIGKELARFLRSSRPPPASHFFVRGKKMNFEKEIKKMCVFLSMMVDSWLCRRWLTCALLFLGCFPVIQSWPVASGSTRSLASLPRLYNSSIAVSVAFCCRCYDRADVVSAACWHSITCQSIDGAVVLNCRCQLCRSPFSCGGFARHVFTTGSSILFAFFVLSFVLSGFDRCVWLQKFEKFDFIWLN